MADNSILETNEVSNLSSTENKALHYANNELLQPHEAFGKFVTDLLPVGAPSTESIAVIQEAGRKFNEIVPNERRIRLLYHFTNTEGAKGISKQGLVGKAADARIYLTPFTPDIAKPLSSANDAKGFETYFKEFKTPQSLKEYTNRLVLAMKFKWKHDVQKRILHKTIVPVGADKLDNVFIFASQFDSPALKIDRYNEIYIERQVNVGSDPDFQVFGPFSTKEEQKT